LAAYATASLGFGGTRPAKAIFYTLAAGWCAVVVSSRFWLVRLPIGWTGSRVGPWFRAAEWVALSVVLTLALGESSLRLWACLSGTSLIEDAALDAYRLTPGQDYGLGLHGNSLGYPGPDFRRQKTPGLKRIAALGSSFAIGPAVAFKDNYLTQLEKRLANVEVYNFGVSGACPREFCQVLNQHVWPFDPDLILVSIFVGHDLTEALPLPRYLDPRRHAIYIFLTREPRHAQPDWIAQRLAEGVLSVEEFRKVEARRLAVCLKTAPPGLEKKWQQALAALEQIVDDCRKHQVPLAAVLIPDEYQVSPNVLAGALATAGVDAGAVDLALPQERLLNFFGAHDVPCLDLRPAFLGVHDTYALRNTHWNERGNHLAAEQIAQWLGKWIPEEVISSGDAPPRRVP
jgi:hypothetical protein